ncbi:MAG: biopolymer transporter ExbD [Candidatus Coatesbacteria bacterium]|nr:biopolymer transporter ExbD [Candidatus Coatesbacteria bacterium]
MRIEKKKSAGKIPTSSMADIAFLLLIFFMTTTILKDEAGLEVVYPDTEQGTKTERENTARIWMAPLAGAKKTALTVINDAEIKDYEDVLGIMQKKRDKNPALSVAMNVDEKTPYKDVNSVLEMLRKAHTNRVFFISNAKKGPE